jgi:hypothetical protein
LLSEAIGLAKKLKMKDTDPSLKAALQMLADVKVESAWFLVYARHFTIHLHPRTLSRSRGYTRHRELSSSVL